MPPFKIVNLKGDLFATGFSFAGQSVIKLGSSLILTRILRPEAYGVITILMSIVFVVEMLADIGVTVFIIRDKNGENPRYLNSAWTMRLGRALLNGMALFVFAPLISSSLYHAPNLIGPMRIMSLWFILGGLESMSFPLAIRRKNARIVMYTELITTFISTAFTLIYCNYSRNYWGMVYGILLSRFLKTAISYFFYRDHRPKLKLDRAAAREVLGFTRFTMPSSILTLALSQFDKVVFLRLFNLNLLGVYGLAANITGPIESLISKISQTVLYPRCAHNFRIDQQTFFHKYYTENVKLFVSILILPAAVGGAAHLIISVLYDPRYAYAGTALQAFMIRAGLLALASPPEDLLIATGEYQVILLGNVYRAIWLVAGSMVGYYFFGLSGFVFGMALSGLPPLIYYLWLQRKRGMLIARYELYKLAFVIVVATASLLTSSLLLTLWPGVRIKI